MVLKGEVKYDGIGYGLHKVLQKPKFPPLFKDEELLLIAKCY